jgi:uncharacterized membrane protein
LTNRVKEEEMAEQENVIVVRFNESSKAYQALSMMKRCDAEGRIGLRAAVVAERTPQGELRITDGTTNAAPVGTAGGSLIGMLIGVLGGPVGILMGGGAGALMGSAFDLDRAETSHQALTMLSRAIPTGSTAVIASVEEPAIEVIDGEMRKLGGEVTRRPVGDVLDELDEAEAAAAAAVREARRDVREQHNAELTADAKQRVARMKEKLHAA